MSLLWFVPPFVMWGLAQSLQGAAYNRYVAAGGSRGSTWRVAGLGELDQHVLTNHAFASHNGFEPLASWIRRVALEAADRALAKKSRRQGR